MGGSFPYQEILDLISKFPFFIPVNFVETGTYKGVTTRDASRLFRHVYTIEIMESLYNESRATSDQQGIQNITYYLGDSLKTLPRIVDELNGPTLWFLDAHQSGCDTGNNGINVPLLQELDIILNSIGRYYPSIFVLDDLRLFSKYWDWDGINTNTILEKFRNKRVLFQTEENDRYIVVCE